jgi:hypothetical protein
MRNLVHLGLQKIAQVDAHGLFYFFIFKSVDDIFYIDKIHDTLSALTQILATNGGKKNTGWFFGLNTDF